MDPPVAPAPPRTRAPKPSQSLDPDARRLLRLLLPVVDIEYLAAIACESESTIRRFAAGQTGARASVRMLTQAVIVAVVEKLPDVARTDAPALRRLSREHTPGGCGLDLPALVDAPAASARRPRPKGVRVVRDPEGAASW